MIHRTIQTVPWGDGAGDAPDAAPSPVEDAGRGSPALKRTRRAASSRSRLRNAASALRFPRNPWVDAPDPAQPYRVLARKYRPQTFSELIGQEPMVHTLANAIARDRLAHAFLMTGVRGVGKTSTARLIAKALNCIGPDGQGGPTIDPCGVCEPCTAIAEGRHIDVIEMDAASHTGVDDVREIIEAVRYSAVSARYKIYIIDEVHMLSRNAFNALLKTLEEPPAHVKFLFATTEVDKLPVTVLSRTQRFDLQRSRRTAPGAFRRNLPQGRRRGRGRALAIVNAAEGSVAGFPSSIKRSPMPIWAPRGSDADHRRARSVHVRPRRQGAQRHSRTSARRRGALLTVWTSNTPRRRALAMMQALMDIVHRITVRCQAASPTRRAPRSAPLTAWPKRSLRALHRLWQLLLKGHEEVAGARSARIRAHGAPAAACQRPSRSGAAGPDHPDAAGRASDNAGRWRPRPGRSDRLADLVAKVEDAGQHLAASTMKLQIRPIAVESGLLRYSRDARYRDDIGPQLREALHLATGERWQLEEAAEGGTPSVIEREQEAAADARREAREHPMVTAAFAAFPDAELLEEKPAPSPRRDWRREA